MSGELDYDEDGVHAQMTRLVALAEEVSEARTALNTAITGQNGAWSNEPGGQYFTQQLLSVADSVLTGFDELRAELENTAADLYTSAGLVVDADDDVIAAITALQTQAESGEATSTPPTASGGYAPQTAEAQEHLSEVEQAVEQSQQQADEALSAGDEGEGS